jgi:hypothetical protein
MNYRLLSAEEMIRLGQELENYRRWEKVRDFVRALYGTEAHQVTISVLSQYNDSSYNEDANVIVTDREENRLSFDFSLPWWSAFELSQEQIQEFLKDDDGSLSVYKFGDTVQEALEAFCTSKLGIEFLEHWEPQDPITSTYIVGTPPPVSFAEVYVEEGSQLTLF